MEDAKKADRPPLTRTNDQNKNRHLQTDDRSVAAGSSTPTARPYISLKARMLGGHAETILRLRGFTR